MEYGYEALLAAYVRGTGTPPLPPALAGTPLEALTDGELAQIIALGRRAGLKLYHFKQKDDLP